MRGGLAGSGGSSVTHVGFTYSVRPRTDVSCPHGSTTEDPRTHEIYCAECGVVLTFPPIDIAFVSAKRNVLSHIARYSAIREWSLQRLREGRSLASVATSVRRRGIPLSLHTVYLWSKAAGVRSGSKRGGLRSRVGGRPTGGAPWVVRERLRREAQAIAERLGELGAKA